MWMYQNIVNLVFNVQMQMHNLLSGLIASPESLVAVVLAPVGPRASAPVGSVRLVRATPAHTHAVVRLTLLCTAHAPAGLVITQLISAALAATAATCHFGSTTGNGINCVTRHGRKRHGRTRHLFIFDTGHFSSVRSKTAFEKNCFSVLCVITQCCASCQEFFEQLEPRCV